MSIEARDIHKSFGAFKALDNVSLDFPTGELIALLGPSGCGKTTLLRIIAGLESPDRGSILLGGQDASDTHVRDRRVGFVFQHYALFRHMSVFENVAFGLRVRPRATRPSESRIRARVHELLDLVQLGWVADRLPEELSGGQRQRIALARALAVEPRVLLLDEPFGALDAKVRKELRRWLRRLHDELHVTSVFVTHDQEEALEVSDRVVVMNHGRVEQIGAPQEICENPATPFVCGFIGSANEFRGRIEGGFLRVANGWLPHRGNGLRDGTDVIAYARPCDLTIDRESDGSHGLAMTVSRILVGGAIARIELAGAGGPIPDYVEVEMPREQIDWLALAPGSAVRLSSRRLSVFPARDIGGAS